jgi:superfamily II DNA or RNA helicase
LPVARAGCPKTAAAGRLLPDLDEHAMQILRPGTSVHVRRRLWRVMDTRAYDGCQLVTLSSAGSPNPGQQARFLMPFDAIEPVPATRRLRVVRSSHWRQACRHLLAARGSDACLRAAAGARIDLLPHQLEPALSLVRGHTCRVLIADDVGLGKTIQAGLAIAELRLRQAADRILIVTPAGLREQWQDELSRRFDVHADIVDVRAVATRASALPYAVNPWSTWPVAIASIDYVKRPEVLPAVAACAWDAIVVDEAHGVANDSERHHAIVALADRTAYVILLTATPHNGDAQAFRSLCDIGGRDERLLIFRRTRLDVRAGTSRRVHCLMLRPSREERLMHALLDEFAAAVRAERGDEDRDVWLALALLHKRASSSAHALCRTVTRRLEAMDGDSDGGGLEQLLLPLDDHGEADADDEAPPWSPAIGLRDRRLERRLLTRLADAAAAASASETKLAALSRLLRRIAEPVIVFTEYRDTLVHVAGHIGSQTAILHGGLSRQERSAALNAFASGARRVLLATDAAGEGLNLQRRCRTVINLELPWNPMRLEQRVGRVDRIGQRQTVHAFHLVAAGTGEERLLATLRDKIARARRDIGVPDPLLRRSTRPADDVRIAMVIAGGIREPAAHTPAETSDAFVTMAVASGREDAIIESRRVAGERAFAASVTRPGLTSTVAGSTPGPLVARARNAHTRRSLGDRVVLVWEVAAEDGSGRLIASEPLAVAAALNRAFVPPLSRASIDRLVQLCCEKAQPLLEHAMASSVERATSTAEAFVSARLAREHAVGRALAPPAFQPGLFDRRAEHALAAAIAARLELAAWRPRRVAAFEQRANISPVRPVLRLVLLP